MRVPGEVVAAMIFMRRYSDKRVSKPSDKDRRSIQETVLHGVANQFRRVVEAQLGKHP